MGWPRFCSGEEIKPSRVRKQSHSWHGCLQENQPRARDHRVRVDDGRRQNSSGWCFGTGRQPVRGTNPWSKTGYKLLDHQRGQKSKTNLGDAKVGENEAAGTGGSPDEEHLDPKTSRAGLFVDQVGGCVTDTEVPKPVGGNRHGHCFGSDVEREDLTGDDPGDGAPCGGEERDIDADKSDQSLLSGDVLSRDCDTNDGGQELANAHADGTDQEGLPSTELLDIPHARESHEDVDDIDGDSDQERVGNARVLEKRGTGVDDEVETGELLPGLEGNTSEGTEKDFVGGAEAVEVRRLAQFLLALERNADLVKFGLDFGVVGRKGEKTGERTSGILVALLLDEPSRRFGEEGHTDGDNEPPNELESDGKLPRSTGGPVLCGVVDDGGEEKTDCDCPLITCHEGATVITG